MVDYTIEEQIVCEIARSFGPDDDFIVSATNNCGFVGIALAKELYAPKLSFYMAAKGKGAFLRNVRYPFMIGAPPERFIETLVNMEDIFDALGRGKWCMIMQSVQIDKYGYTNLSLVGDINRPSNVFVGSRAVPDNTINYPRTLYFVPKHAKRVFVEKVDFISGVGYGKERREGVVKWGAPAMIITNLCVMDFDEESGRVRLKSIHTGITLDQIKDNTGFDLILPDPVPGTEPPSAEELHWIREIIDPSGISRLDFLKGEAFKQVLSEIIRGTTYQSLYSRE
jgi:acyl CoA:acetate/3-ketoacid CoA transferase beta subunit